MLYQRVFPKAVEGALGEEIGRNGVDILDCIGCKVVSNCALARLYMLLTSSADVIFSVVSKEMITPRPLAPRILA